ncbi:PH domain-containing protein [Actinoplanes sp. NPDC051513]|uniref:PH domain-containing protein n=1 Tax=Actinoplanes sp. NPDC051513 TaxID=3363908 RepID=UPI0037B21B25
MRLSCLPRTPEFAMSRSWTRPYEPGRGRWWVVLWEAGALAYLHWATSRMLGLTDALELALAGFLAVVWLAGAWRIHRIGLYTSDDGIMIRNLMSTRKLTWQQVDNITVEQVGHRVGAFAIPSGKCIMIRRGDGARVNTSLWEKGVDFHAQPERFRALYQELRDRHATAIRRETTASAA